MNDSLQDAIQNLLPRSLDDVIRKHRDHVALRIATPEDIRAEFIKHLVSAQVPVIPGEGDCDCVYAFDWILFAERNGLL